MKTVIGMFGNARAASDTLPEFARLGLSTDKVGILTATKDGGSALRSIDLPDIGPVAANIPMLEWLNNTGGIVGALYRLGVPRADAERCIASLKGGGTIEAVVVDDGREAEVQAIMRSRVQAAKQEKAAQPLRAAAPTRQEDEIAEDVVIPIAKEELEISTRAVDAGGVRVSTRVTAVPVEKSVVLREERVHVERRTVEKNADGEEAFRERSVDLHSTADEPVVTKRAHVVEEIRVHRSRGEHEEKIQDHLRRTRVEVSAIASETKHKPS